MIDVGEALEREGVRFRQDPGARDRLNRRRDRKRRNERVGAAAVAIFLTAALVGALFLVHPRKRVPADEPSGVLNGQIAFARVAGNDPELTFVTYTVNPDGTNVVRLPGGASYQPKPRWSPDGREIAINEPTTPTAECPESVICAAVIVNVDTGAYRGVPWRLPGRWDVGCFAWSPDGTRFACGSIDDNGTDLSGIYTIDSSDGGDPTRITPCGECVPGDFSPDGTRIVFSVSNDGRSSIGLFTVRLDGTGLRRITPAGMLLDAADGGRWSPTGDQIVFQARSAPGDLPSIWVVDADGSRPHEVPIEGCGGSSGPGAGVCQMPAWSPDGTKIVFSRRSPDPSSVAGIYEVNADGSAPVRITTDDRDNYQADWGTRAPAT